MRANVLTTTSATAALQDPLDKDFRNLPDDTLCCRTKSLSNCRTCSHATCLLLIARPCLSVLVGSYYLSSTHNAAMAGALKIVLVSLACAALVLQPAAAYSFNFGKGNYGGGIYQGANYYQSHGLSYGQYRSDVGNALRRSGASASAASSGFSSAMAQALSGRDYRTYGYACSGALGYGSKGSWTSAFNSAKSRGFNRSGAAAAAAATSGGQFGGDVGSATAAAASSAFGGSAASAAASGRKLLEEAIAA